MTVLNSESFDRAAYALVHAIQDFRGVDPEPFRQIVADFGDHVTRLEHIMTQAAEHPATLSDDPQCNARAIVRNLDVQQLRNRLEELDSESKALCVLLWAAIIKDKKPK